VSFHCGQLFGATSLIFQFNFPILFIFQYILKHFPFFIHNAKFIGKILPSWTVPVYLSENIL